MKTSRCLSRMLTAAVSLLLFRGTILPPPPFVHVFEHTLRVIREVDKPKQREPRKRGRRHRIIK